VRQHGNTLFVTAQGSFVGKEDEAVVVRVEGELKGRVPIHSLDGIVLFGQASCSPALMALCCERNVTVSFLTESGRFLGRVEGANPGNVLVRREQYRRADDEVRSARIAAAIVAGKVANCRTVLLRALRDNGDAPGHERLASAAERLKGRLRELTLDAALDVVRGLEGDCARTYFEAFDDLITSQKHAFAFHGRSRRPPLDAMNSLLSFLYVLLEHDVRGALYASSFDPAVGFLHRDRPGRPGLALDLMEELRPVLADRLALSLVNLRQVAPDGFHTEQSGAVLMSDDTRKTVIVAYQQRKQETITHPFLDERTTLGLVPHIQARLLARHLRGDLDGYPPFLWR
jgi:CRISPR-associated protein Cas1